MTFHVMIIPTLGCPSNCAYCWGSEENAELMDIDVINQIVKWLANFRDEPVHFTFHGGEPLLAGYEFYEKALPLLNDATTHETEGFPHKVIYGYWMRIWLNYSQNIILLSVQALMVLRKSMIIKEVKATLIKP